MPVKKNVVKKAAKKQTKKKPPRTKFVDKGGRPSKYTQKILDRTRAYLTDFKQHDAVFPSNVGLALYLDLNRETVQVWSNDKDKPEFSDMLAKIKAIQHQMLIGNGISGEYNSNITKLVLTKHDYSDKQENKDTTPPLDMSDDELNRKILHLESLKEQGLRD